MDSAADFVSREWRDSFQCYATGLKDLLRADLSAISDTGVPLPGDHRIARTIESFDSRPEYQKQRNQENAISTVAPEIQAPLNDATFFERWQLRAVPLLILGPFGTGKSVLLALFSFRLAEQLESWCESPSGPAPWVPFPVRLRMWRGHVSLKDYLEKQAQQEINPSGASSWLRQQQIRHLVESRKLLPLFDGLDELPISVKYKSGTKLRRKNAIDEIWRMFPRHHMISSRPGEGVDTVKYASQGSIQTLRELDVAEAVRTLDVRLTTAQSAIFNKAFGPEQRDTEALFRQPLFLNAWFRRATTPGARAPTNRIELLDLLFEQMLDQRISDDSDHEYEALRLKIIRDRHCVGAVLSIYADIGFGVEISNAQVSGRIPAHSANLSLDLFNSWEKHAIKLGLLQRGTVGTYLPRMPVAEYLIGCYYAWLAAGEQIEQRHLASSFQKRFYWTDFAEIWRYAFEMMWRGTLKQRQMAGDLAAWVTELSRKCLDSTNWDEPLETDQAEGDRHVLGFDHIALDLLLPAGIDDPAANELSRDAIERMQSLHARLWNDLGSFRFSAKALNQLAQHRPRLVIDWLVRCLKHTPSENVSQGAALALSAIAQRLDLNDIGALVRLFSSPEHHPVFGMIGFILSNTAPSFDREVVDMLLSCLEAVNCKQAWKDIASAIADKAKTLTEQERSRLALCLERELAEKRRIELARLSAGQTESPEEYDGPAFGILLAIRETAPLFRETNMVSRLVWLEEEAVYHDHYDRSMDSDHTGGTPNKGLKRIADNAARLGRMQYAQLVANNTTGIIFFVREIRPNAEPSRRIVYGAASRGDEDLLLNLAFAPDRIRRMLSATLPSGAVVTVDYPIAAPPIQSKQAYPRLPAGDDSHAAEFVPMAGTTNDSAETPDLATQVDSDIAPLNMPSAKEPHESSVQSDASLPGGAQLPPHGQHQLSAFKLVLELGSKRLLLNDKEVARRVTDDVIIILKKLRENRDRLWQYKEFFDCPPNAPRKIRELHQARVAKAVRSLPKQVKTLLKSGSDKGHNGGRQFPSDVELEVKG